MSTPSPGPSRREQAGRSSDSPAAGVVDELDLAVSSRRQRKSLGRLWSLLGQSLALSWQVDRWLVVRTIALQLSGAVVLAAQVVIVKLVLDAILALTQGSGTVRGVLVPISLLALVNALTAVTSAMQANEQRLLGELVMRSTWQQLLDVAGTVELIAFEEPRFFDKLQRVQMNALSRPTQLIRGVVGIVGGLAGSVGVALAIIGIEPLLLPLLLLAGVPVLVTSRRESRLEFDFAVRQTPRLRLRQYLSLVQTGRDEAKEVRAFGLTGFLRGRFDAVYADYLDDLRDHVRHRTRLALTGNLLSAVFLAATLFVLVWLIGQERVDLASAGAAIVAIRLLATQVTSTIRSAQGVFESGLFLDDLNDFVGMRPSGDPVVSGDPAPDAFEELTVDRVSFSYPGSDTPALEDVDLRLKAGEVVALVGENGSGKTTLAKLLAALYDPTRGAVRWDGRDATNFRRDDLRRSVALIFQDFVHYHLSAADNIGIGDVDRIDDRAAVEAAGRRAEIDGAIQHLPDGYDTILSRMFKGGRDVSGGQWQRVALARAFFRDAPLVILDEPTASLDPRAEHRLFTSLRDLLDGRSVLFISHRFSTVRSADRIYVLRDGRVIEHGTHDALMAQDGHYAELFRLQAAAYLSPDGRS